MTMDISFGILVICPNGVKGTWKKEIEIHMADHVDRNVVSLDRAKNKKTRRGIKQCVHYRT